MSVLEPQVGQQVIVPWGVAETRKAEIVEVWESPDPYWAASDGGTLVWVQMEAYGDNGRTPPLLLSAKLLRSP